MRFHVRNVGWSAKIRTKVSPRAAEGYLYEIRFKTVHLWRRSKSQAMLDILETARSSFGKYKINRNGKYFNRTQYVIYVASESDLLILRMVDRENLLFRIYKLAKNA